MSAATGAAVFDLAVKMTRTQLVPYLDLNSETYCSNQTNSLSASSLSMAALLLLSAALFAKLGFQPRVYMSCSYGVVY